MNFKTTCDLKTFDATVDIIDGITITYMGSTITVSWAVVRDVMAEAARLVGPTRVIEPSVSATDPKAGSLGDYVKKQGLGITPRHLSHLGPVMHYLGLLKAVTCVGNTLKWELW